MLIGILLISLQTYTWFGSDITNYLIRRIESINSKQVNNQSERERRSIVLVRAVNIWVLLGIVMDYKRLLYKGE